MTEAPSAHPVVDTGPVLAERRGHVLVLRIDRPQTRNALSTEVLRSLAEQLRSAEADSDVRAVVLTGGPQLFAAGADVRELGDLTPADYLQSERQRAWPVIAQFRKPMVAAVAGYVLGGGCELALSCDFVVAGDSAVFGQPEINLGIIPGAGGTQRWSRVIGRFRAAELLLTGRTIDAWTALELGMANQVVPSECVVEAGVQLASRLAELSPMAQRMGKASLRASEEVGISAGLLQERSNLAVLLSTEDKTEGIAAFLDKRPAEFTGR